MKNLEFQVTSSDGAPVEGAAVLMAYPNGTYLTGFSNHNGHCQFSLYRSDQPVKILAAAGGYLPFKTTIDPTLEEPVRLKLEPSKDERKALLFTKDTGYIPGVEGRLNPHKDGYVYANNIAINGQLATPAVRFRIGESLHLIDVFGVETTIRFVDVEGQFSLIEYTEPKAYAGNDRGHG